MHVATQKQRETISSFAFSFFLPLPLLFDVVIVETHVGAADLVYQLDYVYAFLFLSRRSRDF